MSVSSRGNQSPQCLEPHFGRDTGFHLQDQTARDPAALAADPEPGAAKPPVTR